MSDDAPTFSVQVDVTNPGQFFACCGVLEVAHRLMCSGATSDPIRPVEGWFDGDQFHVTCPSGEDGSALSEFVRVGTECAADLVELDGCDRKIAPVHLPAPLDLRLDWWLGAKNSATRFKTWAANATSLQMYAKWSAPLKELLTDVGKDPSRILTVSALIQGSYGFDSSLGWNALDVGFSLNRHDGLKRLPLRPAVELFGAIGLQRFRPPYDQEGDFVEYRTWRIPLSAIVAAPIVSGAVTCPFSTRFRSRFVKRGSFKGLDVAARIGEHS
jgi:CRISPR-associated protein Csx14